MSEQVKINPDLLIILVGSVINKFISEYEGDLPDNRASIPVEDFITQLNNTTRKYTQDFPNDEINFPYIDIKLLSFIINRTLYFKFVSVVNDQVMVEVGDKYENYLKNIVATSTFRYSKFLLNGAKLLYKSEQESAKASEEVIETTEEVRDEQPAEPAIATAPEEEDKEKAEPLKKKEEAEPLKKKEDEVADPNQSVGDNEEDKVDTPAQEGVELASPEIEELSQVEGDTSQTAEIEQKESVEEVVADDVDKESDVPHEPSMQNEEKSEDVVEKEIQELVPKEDDTEQQEIVEQEEAAKEEPTEPLQEGVKSKAEQVVPKSPSPFQEVVLSDVDKRDSETKEISDTQNEEPTTAHEISEQNIEQSSPLLDEATVEVSSPTLESPKNQEPKEKSVEVVPPGSKPDSSSRKRPRSRSPAPAQHHKRFQNIAVNLLNSIQEHRFSSPFLQAVNPKDAPNYYEMIYEPKDLKGIMKALKSKKEPPVYLLIKELERDVMLMFANCIMYNRLDEDLVELTRTMKRDVGDMFKMFKEAELEMK